jgi:hypothetical protein
MKMSWSILLGLFVILAGVSILLQAVFHIHIPIFRTGLALILIFLGVRMLFQAWTPAQAPTSPETQAVMTESIFRPEAVTGGSLKYDVIFSKGLVDLTHLPRLERDLTVEINSVFSATVVKVDPSFNYEVEGSAAFGAVQLPDGQQTAFGGLLREVPGTREGGPRLRLKLAAVFGACKLEEAPTHMEERGVTHHTLPAERPAG